MQLSNQVDIALFWNDLSKWHAKHKRTFPWRDTNNPYAILIAEVLLQKTKAGRSVIEAYNEIITKYPTVNHLCKSDFNDLLNLFKPLGLPRRAEYLKCLAKDVVERYSSNIPCTLNELLQLPGVGQYSARAILSFAFCHDTPVVDMNVARFLYRFAGIESPFPKTPTRDKQLLDIAHRYMPKGHSRDFNYALLDLCAIVCSARKPLCDACPVTKYCMHSFHIKSLL
jgi:A/G-specific adenine glycosylase